MNRTNKIVVTICIIFSFSCCLYGAALEPSCQPFDPKINNDFLGLSRYSSIDEFCGRLNILANLLMMQEVTLKVTDAAHQASDNEKSASQALMECLKGSKKSIQNKLLCIETKLDPPFQTVEGIITLIDYRDKILGLKLLPGDLELAKSLLESDNPECKQAGNIIETKLKSQLASQKYSRIIANLSYLYLRIAHTLDTFSACPAYHFIAPYSEFCKKMESFIDLSKKVPDTCETIPTSFWDCYKAGRTLFGNDMPTCLANYQVIRPACIDLYGRIRRLVRLKAQRNYSQYFKQIGETNKAVQPDGSIKTLSDREWQQIKSTIPFLPSRIDSMTYVELIPSFMTKKMDSELKKPLDHIHDRIMTQNADLVSHSTELKTKQVIEFEKALQSLTSTLGMTSERLKRLQSELMKTPTQLNDCLLPAPCAGIAGDLSVSAAEKGDPASQTKAEAANTQIQSVTSLSPTTQKSKKHSKKSKFQITEQQQDRSEEVISEQSEDCSVPEPISRSSAETATACVTGECLEANSPRVDPKKPQKDSVKKINKKKNIPRGIQKPSQPTADYLVSETQHPHVVTLEDVRYNVRLSLYLPQIKSDRPNVNWHYHTDMMKLWFSNEKEALCRSGETNQSSLRYRTFYSYDLPLENHNSLRRICMIHNFSKLVDVYIKKCGIIQDHISRRGGHHDMALILPGHIDYKNGNTEDCIFCYLVDGLLLYHRNIEFRSRIQLGQEFLAQGYFTVQDEETAA